MLHDCKDPPSFFGCTKTGHLVKYCLFILYQKKSQDQIMKLINEKDICNLIVIALVQMVNQDGAYCEVLSIRETDYGNHYDVDYSFIPAMICHEWQPRIDILVEDSSVHVCSMTVKTHQPVLDVPRQGILWSIVYSGNRLWEPLWCWLLFHSSNDMSWITAKIRYIGGG